MLHEEMSVGPSEASFLPQGSGQEGTDVEGRLHFLYSNTLYSGCLTNHLAPLDSCHAKPLVQGRDCTSLPPSCFGSVGVNVALRREVRIHFDRQ